VKIAIIGHIPFDRYVLPDGSSHTGFGGVLYGAAALADMLGKDGEVIVVSRVGETILDPILNLLAAYSAILPKIDTIPGDGWVVEAVYLDGERRQERLTGNVPPWSADDLLEQTLGSDALLLNMVTGFEIGIGEFEKLAETAPPMLLDFHGLAMGRTKTGLRFPRASPDARRWCSRAQMTQMNSSELASVLPEATPDQGAAMLTNWGSEWAAITDGSHGVYVAENGKARHLPAVDPTSNPTDPTGCGDVFGACFLIEKMRGSSLNDAAAAAQDAARLNADQPGIPKPRSDVGLSEND